MDVATRHEATGTASTVAASPTGLSGATPAYLLSLEVTNLSATVDLILRFGASGAQITIPACDTLSWREPIPDGRKLVIDTTNAVQVLTAASTAAYLAVWYTE